MAEVIVDGVPWSKLLEDAEIRGDIDGDSYPDEVEYDDVQNPKHYTEGRKYEPAEVVIDWDLDWCLGNALKYIARCGRKSNAIEDLEKARWYINREIKKIEEER